MLKRLTGFSLGRRREYCTKRIAELKPLLNDKRSISVLRSIRYEIAELEEELKEVELRVLDEPHSYRPNGLRKGNTWICNCGEFNIWENKVCWASKIQIESKPRPVKKPNIPDYIKPQSSFIDDDFDVEKFFKFLDYL